MQAPGKRRCLVICAHFAIMFLTDCTGRISCLLTRRALQRLIHCGRTKIGPLRGAYARDGCP